MGQHKTNPTAIKAKNGEIEPKKPEMSKRQQERLLYAWIYNKTVGHLKSEFPIIGPYL